MMSCFFFLIWISTPILCRFFFLFKLVVLFFKNKKERERYNWLIMIKKSISFIIILHQYQIISTLSWSNLETYRKHSINVHELSHCCTLSKRSSIEFRVHTADRVHGAHLPHRYTVTSHQRTPWNAIRTLLWQFG